MWGLTESQSLQALFRPSRVENSTTAMVLRNPKAMA